MLLPTSTPDVDVFPTTRALVTDVVVVVVAVAVTFISAVLLAFTFTEVETGETIIGLMLVEDSDVGIH
jgi:hypothetical protein